jgi:multimeric flavodoxin WrbA
MRLPCLLARHILEEKNMKKILVVFHSQEKGNTAAMAKLVAEGCRQVPDVEVALYNTNKGRVDMHQLEQVDGLALGTPDYFTYMAGGLKMFFDDAVLAMWAGGTIKGKPCVAFCTHGGGGGAIRSVESLAKQMEWNLIAPSVVCKGAPSGEAAKQAMALGKALAECIMHE